MNADLYRKLFVHRADVFSQQTEKGNYAPVGEGHFDKRTQRYVYDSYTPLDDTHIDEHLGGHASYGVYVLDTENTCKYVVFDLDTYDSDALDFLTRAVERLVDGPRTDSQRRCLLLEDSGGKGYHIWLFLSEPVPAARVRAWTEAVRRGYVQMANTVAPESDKWPPLEIFPKQDEVPEGAFGNLVKLPFGVHAKTKAQALIRRREGWAMALEEVVPFPVALIPDAVTPAKPASVRGQGGRAPFACIAKLLEEGAPDGCRDKAMYHAAAYWFGHGLAEDLALDQCLRTNELFDPPMPENEVRTKVRSAYGRQYPAGCGDDWLEDFCPGGGRCPWTKAKEATSGPNAYPVNGTPDERKAWRLANAGDTD